MWFTEKKNPRISFVTLSRCIEVNDLFFSSDLKNLRFVSLYFKVKVSSQFAKPIGTYSLDLWLEKKVPHRL